MYEKISINNIEETSRNITYVLPNADLLEIGELPDVFYYFFYNLRSLCLKN